MAELDTTGNESQAGWGARVRRSLTETGGTIAELLVPGEPPGQLAAHLVKANRDHVSCRLRAGQASGFYKHFDGSGEGVSVAYRKERDALRAMSPSRLVPRLIAWSDTHHWILTEDLGTENPDIKPVEFARRAGAWVAAYEAAAPFERATGNWFGYLVKLGLEAELRQMPAAEGLLRAIPLCGRVLSRNDTALHNFILDPAGRMIGCDFETASLRPRGWEYISIWGALFERYAEDAGTILEAYAESFDHNHRGGLIVDELNTVARILACARIAHARPVSARPVSARSDHAQPLHGQPGAGS